ncbi:heat-labile enterotoxin alpha chain domain-containing protein [Pochonia chlamydosporia 170]|uniref:Heat-labile enterotoxin alpha chain domain-containing protein n=1 Tax=Pochonia chlamydosporia 170 TaxID=1380566 RepID=A0A179FC62_METCM|nr:heat-labile enterotoxin alpha chain domain-containing protein [Pochonia chlamydosporia 170]OAQ62699.1 heat-labile enterotoxin alpha chain domain-containing protein [Pochonia chlamydosporia 170]
MRNWLSFILWTTLLLFLGYGDSHVLHRRADDDLVSTVWRGDLRTPDDIRRAGGFYARVKTGPPITARQLETGSSLFKHHGGKIPDITQFVSASTDPNEAVKFAAGFKVKQIEAGAKPGYVYRISTDPKFVDMEKSIGIENVQKGFEGQAEHLAVEGVPFDQIEGWYAAEDILKNRDEIVKQLKSGDLVESIYTRNTAFNERYLPLRGSGAQPQLASFGTRKDDIARWEKEPWKQYKGKKASTNLAEFRAKIQADAAVPQAAASFREPLGFVEADPLGARDLIARLDGGEVPEGLNSVEIAAAAAEAETLEVTAELEAAEAAEAAEAIEAAELVEAAEAAEMAALGEASVVRGVIGWILRTLASLLE